MIAALQGRSQPVTELWRYTGYRRVLLAQSISELGNWLTNVALILLVLRLTEHPAAAALVLLAKLLPRALVYPIGGVLADKLDRRWLMIIADLARVGLALSLLLARSPNDLWWVLTVTMLAQVLTSVYNPAAMALVPGLVPAPRLASANALLGAVKEMASFLGPLLGTLALGPGGLELAFTLDAGTFLISALLLAGLRGQARPVAGRVGRAVRRDLAEGWAVVRESRVAQVCFAAQVLYGSLIAALNVLLVPLLVTHWHGPEAWLGVLYGAVSGGALLGAVVALRLSPSAYVRTTLVMLGLMGAIALGLGLAPWLAPAIGLLFVAGIAVMVGDVASNTAIQGGVADQYLGRVFGLLFWAVAVGQAGGAALAWFTAAWPPALIIAVLGLVTLAAGGLLAYAYRGAYRTTAASPATLTTATEPS
ncbi:MAG: MFS transporter [Chloroflexi bacterium]|nr:MFS transporter [Chloroflexota bacterium]